MGFLAQRRHGVDDRSQPLPPMEVALDALRVGVVVVDRSGACGYANEAWQELFGQRAGSWQGSGWHASLEPTARQVLLGEIRLGREHRSDVLVRKAGRARTIELWAVPSRDEGRRSCVVTASDVTAERERTAKLEDLATHDEMTGLYNRTQFLEFVAHALDRRRRDPKGVAAVLFIDVDHLKATNDTLGHAAGDELLCTVAARISAAVRPVDVVARFGGDEFAVLCEDLVSPEEADGIAGRVLRAVNAGGDASGGTISVGLAIADDPQVQPEAVVRAADVDMYRNRATDPTRHTPFLRSTAGAVPGSLTSVTGVLAATAHELRTPLTAIIGYAQLLREDGSQMSQTAVDRALEAIEQQGLRLAGTLDELLDLGRTANGSESAPRSVDLADVVRRALESAPAPPGVTMVNGFSTGLPCLVSASGESELARIVVNLLTNAYLHGGATVQVGARHDGLHAELLVTDDGSGVPEAVVPSMFEPFVRGNGAHGSSGSGLGLALASALAIANGGTLTHIAVAPHGARFVLRLPVAVATG